MSTSLLRNRPARTLFMSALAALAMSGPALAQTFESPSSVSASTPTSTPRASNSPYALSEARTGSWMLGAGSLSGYDKVSVAYVSAPVWNYSLLSRPLDLTLEFELGAWKTDRGLGNHMWQATINPMLTWQFDNGVFVQAGIGITRLSTNTFGDKTFGSKFNFSDNLGIGYRFSPTTQVSYRLSHYSNAGFKKPNPGIDMQQILLNHRF